MQTTEDPVNRSLPFLRDGDDLRLNIVIYDGDRTSGETVKETMHHWSGSTDRYDPEQGGTLRLGTATNLAGRIVNAPLATDIRVDAVFRDWEILETAVARIGPDAPITTDDGSSAQTLLTLFQPPMEQTGSFTLTGHTFANNGVLEAGCSLFPSTGMALLRDHLAANGRAPLDATCVSLTYGPYGGGHGHPDKLSTVLFSGGRQIIPDFGSCAYESPEKAQWTSQTLSHNTLVVDATSQMPTGSGNPGWPVDSFEHRAMGSLEFFHADAVAKAVAARCDSVYDGVGLRRLLILVDNLLIDVFDADSEASHTVDYVLHIDAEPLDLSSEPLPDGTSLGLRCGYQLLSEVACLPPSTQALTSTWGKATKPELRLVAAPGVQTQLFTARGMTDTPKQQMPMMILRRQAARTRFAVCLQPLGDKLEPEPRWTSTPTALVLTCGTTEIVLAIDPQRPASTQTGTEITGEAAVVSRRDDRVDISAIAVTALHFGKLTLTFPTASSCHTTLAEDGGMIALRADRHGLQATLTEDGEQAQAIRLQAHGEWLQSPR